jgi:hypothetical protein
MDERPTSEAPSVNGYDRRPSPTDRVRDALLRLQLEVAGAGPASGAKRRLALLGLGSLLAFTIQVKGAGAAHPHPTTPNSWASSGCGSSCSPPSCYCWPCQRCC